MEIIKLAVTIETLIYEGLWDKLCEMNELLQPSLDSGFIGMKDEVEITAEQVKQLGLVVHQVHC
jgi:hypothetical protein